MLYFSAVGIKIVILTYLCYKNRFWKLVRAASLLCHAIKTFCNMEFTGVLKTWCAAVTFINDVWMCAPILAHIRFFPVTINNKRLETLLKDIPHTYKHIIFTVSFVSHHQNSTKGFVTEFFNENDINVRLIWMLKAQTVSKRLTICEMWWYFRAKMKISLYLRKL